MTAPLNRKWAGLGVVCVLAFACVARAQETDERIQQMKRHFADAVKAFENEQYREAATQLEEVLKLSPASAEALELRDMADIQFYLQAVTKGTPEMRANVFKLLELAAEAEKIRLSDKERIAELVKRLGTSEYEERARIYIELTSAGRNAVPPLVQRLLVTDAPDYEEYRVRATVALIRIGEEAVLPLAAALRSDSMPLRQDICFILGQIGDPLAVPYLVRAAKSDTKESVRSVAQIALNKIRRYAVVPDSAPEAALFHLARLYYYGDPSVRRSSRFGHAIWNWSADEKRLVIQIVPDFLYNVSMARNVLVDALQTNPDYDPVLPYLISTYHKEISLVERRLEMGRTMPEMKLSELEERELLARVARVRDVLLTLRSSGEKHFYRALSLQLHDQDPALATAVIGDLAVTASPELNVYSTPPEMFAPLRPSVIIVTPRTERASSSSGERAPRLPADAPASRPRVEIDVAALFPGKVEAEKKVTTPKSAPAREVNPAERETLNYLIDTARRQMMERREAEAEAESVMEKKKESAPLLQDNPLIMALGNRDKGVRYSAAATLVRVRPVTDFASSKTVVEVLGQAVTERGVSTVLIVGKDDQTVNLLREIVRNAGHTAYSAGSPDAAVSAARSLPPKDLIIADSEMSDAISALQKDPVTGSVPVLVFTGEEDTSVARQTYGDQAAGVFSLKSGEEQITGQIAKAILGSRTSGEGRDVSVQYARMGADAIAEIPRSGSPFSPHLAAIKEPLTGALDSADPHVRVIATAALGKAGATALIPRLIDIFHAGATPPAERNACIEAIGSMMSPGTPTPPDVVALMEEIQKSGNVDLRTFAAEKLKGAAIPPSNLEKLINRQEAAESVLPEAPAPGKEELAPEKEEPAPEKEAPAPEKEAPAPGKGGSAPVTKEPPPEF